jgi:folate-dependent phosphoribosylglycinamide formyltransferase PurN
MISVVIITGNEKRHQYFASQICLKLDVKAVYLEQKANVHNKTDFGEGNSIVADHFKKRNDSEEKYFTSIPGLHTSNIFELPTGAINEKACVDNIITIDPDYIILFGSSLIKEPLLDKFKNRVINLHLGLSPYYRGSGTNFWPLVHKKPECVGATIHLATTEVDAGAILQQVRPSIKETDTIHDLGNKTILAAIDVLPAVIQLYHQNSIQGITQHLENSFVCKRKDLTSAAIKLMYDNFNNGMISDYLQNSEQRIKNYPIINQI